MDDIDRTFNALKRAPYITVFREMVKIGGIGIDQDTCLPILGKWPEADIKRILNDHNWSRADFTEELKIKKYGK